MNLHPFVVMKGDRRSGGGGSQTLLLEIHLQSVTTSHVAVSHLCSSFNFNSTFEYLPHVENAVQWEFFMSRVNFENSSLKKTLHNYLFNFANFGFVNKQIVSPLKLRVRLSKDQRKLSFNITIPREFFFSRQ